MTNHVVRLYALALAVIVFFVTWAAVAARPWPAPTAADTRLAALDAREQRLRERSAAVQRILEREPAATATTPARVVSAPAVTETQSS
jgi:hypothetical protein